MSYATNDRRQAWIDGFLDGEDTVLRVLAMSWMDAKNYRSVHQNAGQRMSLIEKAIREYEATRNRADGTPVSDGY